MIGIICFGIGLLLGMAATFLNVMVNYDGESSVLMIAWSFVVVIGLLLLFLFISVVTFGGIIL